MVVLILLSLGSLKCLVSAAPSSVRRSPSIGGFIRLDVSCVPAMHRRHSYFFGEGFFHS